MKHVTKVKRFQRMEAEEAKQRNLQRIERVGLLHLLFSFEGPRVFLICGGIAQLGERLNGIQEASGSNPLTSTIIEMVSHHVL